MRFTTREDVAATPEHVFSMLTDFEAFEREVLRRGADVTKTGDHSQAGAGQGWVIDFTYRGRARKLVSELERFEPGRALLAEGKIAGLSGTLLFDLVPLSPKLTRLTVDLDMKPNTLSARLFVQSLKLTKGLLMKRYRGRVKRLARLIEDKAP